MKTILTTICLTTVLIAAAPPPGVTPTNNQIGNPPPVPDLREITSEAHRQVQRSLELVQSELARTQEQALQLAQTRVEGFGGGAYGGGGSAHGEPMSNVELRIAHVAHRAPQSVLVLQTREFDPQRQVEIEEDLSIMGRILDKAVSEMIDANPFNHAMGINLVLSAGATPIRSLYLDGVGVVFLLNTKVPLLPPEPQQPDEPAPTPKDTAWETARQELYGGPAGHRPPGLFSPTAAASPRAEYDADKVARLQNDLLESLKSATQIRHLDPTDSITVSALGYSGRETTTRARMLSSARHEAFGSPSPVVRIIDPRAGGPGEMHDAVLTMKAQKSDIDAFAAGDLDVEEFRQRIAIQIHALRPAGSNESTALPGMDIESIRIR
jgi:hypothetical protein